MEEFKDEEFEGAEGDRGGDGESGGAEGDPSEDFDTEIYYVNAILPDDFLEENDISMNHLFDLSYYLKDDFSMKYFSGKYESIPYHNQNDLPLCNDISDDESDCILQEDLTKNPIE
jgi:hypothetical protein